MEKSCSYCYAREAEPLKKCSKCKKRPFCSRECQVLDWKNGHKRWCGRSGELGTDFEIKESPGKGLGVFALRSFARDECIMVERPIVFSRILSSDPRHVMKYQVQRNGPWTCCCPTMAPSPRNGSGMRFRARMTAKRPDFS